MNEREGQVGADVTAGASYGHDHLNVTLGGDAALGIGGGASTYFKA
jgi:hypothetical protein